MRKTLFALALLSALPMGAMSHEGDEHSPLRHLTAPGVHLTEVTEKSVISGAYGKLTVWLEYVPAKSTPTYEGWAAKGKQKLPIRIIYEDRILKGDFNGKTFSYAELNKEKQAYVFNTGTGKEEIAFLYEKKDGRHMINPLFVLPLGKEKRLIRLEGEACLGHSLYYAAVAYGLALIEQEQPISSAGKKEDIQKENKK